MAELWAPTRRWMAATLLRPVEGANDRQVAWWSPLFIPLMLALGVPLQVGLVALLRQFGVNIGFGLEHVVAIPLAAFIAALYGTARDGTRLRHQHLAIASSCVAFVAIYALRGSLPGTQQGLAADAIMVAAVVVAGWVFAAATRLPRRANDADQRAESR